VKSEQKDHAGLASDFNINEARVDWHDETLWGARLKRDAEAHQIPEWEALREAASQIKNNVLSNLYDYLIQFETNIINNGILLHWAADANEHNLIVHSILKEHKLDQMVKSKSMLTEECKMNEYLMEHDIDVIDSDLGERILQLAKESPSHIVMPAVHKKKEEIGELFHKHFGTPAGMCDPQFLTETARVHLRQTFLTRRVALTGVNFAVAETGEFVVCTNEGNADIGAHLADIHIASMGIEKIIPRRNHLSIFLRLLARSATGQPITTYSSHFRIPREGQQVHIILVDNGRSTRLKEENFRASLKCIRCGACMNTCPVYRRSGGHSYHSDAVSGPIGAILTPNLDIKKYADLPFASTLCGSCSNVCPVKIDIHQQLYKWRQVIIKQGNVTVVKRFNMKTMAWIFSSSVLFNIAGKVTRRVLRQASFIMKNKFNPWYKQREMPEAPKESFREWYVKNKRKGGK
jgi:L-lactate dehydrogenase complex protein LldF